MNFTYVHARLRSCIPRRVSGWPAILHDLIQLWPLMLSGHNLTLLDDLPEATKGVAADIALYSASAYSWLLPAGRAVYSANIPDCRVVWLWLLHLPLSSGARCTSCVSTQQQCAEVSEAQRLCATHAHPGMCAESRPLNVLPTAGTVLTGIPVPADRCIRTGQHSSAASRHRGYLPSACLPS